MYHATIFIPDSGSVGVVTIVNVPLLLPTLFGKRGIFTRSPLPWVFETFSFHCYHVCLPSKPTSHTLPLSNRQNGLD